VVSKAPGKTIWFGEHFVVLGNPAIVSSINLYTRVYIRDISGKHFVITSKNLNITYDGKGDPGKLLPYVRIVEIFRDMGYYRPFYAEINSRIPVSSGMGSSASTAVAFAAGLAKYYGLELGLDKISKIAYEAEKIVHGKPSGIDNTIATYGGFLYYKKGLFRRIRVRWPPDYLLLIADTGIERSTRIAVEKVLDRYRKRTRIMRKIYEAAKELVEEALKALRKKDMSSLGELMNINHGLLVSIGVTIPEIESIVQNSLKYGALGAKITGAGLGGSVMILVENKKKDRIISRIKDYASRIYTVKPTRYGVTTSTQQS